MDPAAKLALITENLDEVLSLDLIEKILPERNLKVYWGTTPTGKPHLGYFCPAIKIAQLLAAECEVKILLADIHAFLDSLKAPIELVEYRSRWYKFAITAILGAVGVSTDNLTFVLGSSYQKKPEYVMDLYRLAAVTSEHDAKKAGAEIVKASDNPPLSGLIYPLMQVLDEQHLDVDVQFGGRDQRKLFAASKEWLPKLGYRPRAHLLNSMVPGLQGGKMSSSDPNSKIELLDPPDVIRKKVKSAIAKPMVVEENGLLAFIEFVLLPASALKGRREFVVERKAGQDHLVYSTVEKLHEDYRQDILSPQLLKPAVTKAILDLTEPIRAAYEASAEWQELTVLAYPEENRTEKKVEKKKKIKDRGTRFPGGKPAEGDGAEKGPAKGDGAEKEPAKEGGLVVDLKAPKASEATAERPSEAAAGP